VTAWWKNPDIFSLIPGVFGGTLSWYASPRGDKEHTDGMLAEDARWVLERCARRRDRPFFLAVGFYRPHTPYVSPSPYFDRYDPVEMPVVHGWEEDQRDLPQDALGSHKAEHDKLTDDLRRQALQAYFAAVTFMDAQVGRVLDALDELGLTENTIVVFTSDHGYHLGEHGLWQKMSLFEESARVPLIIAGPGVAPGGVAESPVGLIDLYPTLAEMCGVSAPDNLQGQSLVPMLQDPSEPGQGWAITQVRRGRGQQQQFGIHDPHAPMALHGMGRGPAGRGALRSPVGSAGAPQPRVGPSRPPAACRHSGPPFGPPPKGRGDDVSRGRHDAGDPGTGMGSQPDRTLKYPAYCPGDKTKRQACRCK
jgi:hypothetical protein